MNCPRLCWDNQLDRRIAKGGTVARHTSLRFFFLCPLRFWRRFLGGFKFLVSSFKFYVSSFGGDVMAVSKVENNWSFESGQGCSMQSREDEPLRIFADYRLSTID